MIAELDLYGIKLQKGTVIVMRGVVFRQNCEDGSPAFIINECPRLVLNDVTAIIGQPVPILKAIGQKKYEDYHLKYSSDEFTIPFSPEFRERYFSKRGKTDKIEGDSHDQTFISNLTNRNRSEGLEASIVS